MSLPHRSMMVVDDDDEKEIANLHREYLQRFDFTSNTASFTDPLLTFSYYKKDCKLPPIIIIVGGLQEYTIITNKISRICTSK